MIHFKTNLILQQACPGSKIYKDFLKKNSFQLDEFKPVYADLWDHQNDNHIF